MGGSSEETIIVTFQPYGKRVSTKKGATILDAAWEGGIPIRSVCGGVGKCGKCKVIVRSGKVEFDYNPEEKLLTPEELSSGYVLACLTKCLSDCEVFIPPESRVEKQRMQMEVRLPEVKVDPAVRKVYLTEDEVAEDPLRHLNRKVGLSCHISRVVEVGGVEGGVTYTVYRPTCEVLYGERGDTRERLYGLAVDIGTTKIVAYLVNLNTGEIVASASEYNAQIAYGEDVVSRISYAVKKEGGLKTLQAAAVDTINTLIQRTTKSAGVSSREIYDVTVAGNTVMEYLFVGKDPAPLLETKVKVEIPREPFVLNASSVGLNVNPGAKVYCLPNAGRFLGGDTIGDVLVSEMYKSEDISLLIDIGTNVEVVIGATGWLLATTAAAGPAFEGWGVRCGMRAIEGAISSVRIDPDTLKAEYKTIGNAKPKGICGSGLIDLLSEMFVRGIIDPLGKINRRLDSPYIREGVDGYEYVVVPREESVTGMDIVITERDVANLIDSKSAACAAISVLMKKMRLSVEDVRHVYVCGAFGSYINLENAVKIGLIPEFVNADITYIGNGSLGGAYITLVSSMRRRDARAVAELMAYYDLLKDADFMDEYLAGFVLPGKRELFPRWWKMSRELQSA